MALSTRRLGRYCRSLLLQLLLAVPSDNVVKRAWHCILTASAIVSVTLCAVVLVSMCRTAWGSRPLYGQISVSGRERSITVSVVVGRRFGVEASVDYVPPLGSRLDLPYLGAVNSDLVHSRLVSVGLQRDSYNRQGAVISVRTARLKFDSFLILILTLFPPACWLRVRHRLKRRDGFSPVMRTS